MIEVEAPADWQALLVQAGRVGLQQSWAYGAALQARGQRIRRLMLGAAGAPIGLCQIAERRLALSSFAVALRGPVFFAGDADARRAEVADLRAGWRWHQRQFLLLQPEDDAEALEAAGQVLTGGHTVWLDLSPEPEALRAGLAGKWRNALVKAEAAGLSVQEAKGGAPLTELLAREGGQRQARGYLSADTGFLADLVSRIGKADTLVLSARQARETTAAMLFVRHGRAATYLLGWSGPAGRSANAHNLLLWRAMLVLRAAGVGWLDLGGLFNDGLARFKLGTGAALVQFPGGYL